MKKIKYEYWGRGLNDGSKSGMTENGIAAAYLRRRGLQKVRMSDTALVIIAVMMSHLKSRNKHQMIEGGCLSRAALYSANRSCC